MMRKTILLVAAALAVSVLCAEQLDHWVYDSTAKTITDGVWTLSTTLTKNTTNLAVNNPVDDGYPDDPTDPQELNFAKVIQDADDPSKTYSITTLGFSCGTADAWKSNRDRPIIPSAWAGCIGRLVFPPTGSCKFTTLGDTAFSYTTNLAEVVNFLPDEITKLGNCTFRFSSVNQPLYLRGLVSMEGDKKAEYTFCGSKITSVIFGPNLTYLGGGVEYRDVGSFSSSELEEIHFDPAMTGATLAGRYNFAGAPKLKTCPDLKGFSSLSALFVFARTGFTNDTMVIPANVTTFNAGFMNGAGTKNLVFEGLPPTVSGTLNNGTVLTTYVPEKYKTEWAVYTDGNKVVDDASTTWCQAVAGSNYAKFPLIYEAKAGDLGYWVYDADEIYEGGVGTVSDTNGVWKFKATVQGTQLTVGKWLEYPSTPSELDFTQPLTDTKGFPYVFLALNTAFGVDDGRHWVDGYGSGFATEASGSVSALKYPESVISFGSHAFCCCSNLVSVTPMLGDWITSIGNAAFAKTAIKGDLRLMGLASTAMGTFQFCTNLTSVTFGPGLKNFYSHADEDRGTFQGCTGLTNVVFDAAMKGGSLANNQQSFGHHFYGCTNLVGTLDLRGFTVVGYTQANGPMKESFKGTRFDNVIVASNVTEISRDAFLGMGSLTNVTYLGTPPSASAMSKTGFTIYGKLPQKVTTTIKKEYWTDWTPYVDGEKYSLRLRTWKADYVDDEVGVRNRPIIVEGAESGLQLFIR